MTHSKTIPMNIKMHISNNEIGPIWKYFKKSTPIPIISVHEFIIISKSDKGQHIPKGFNKFYDKPCSQNIHDN